MTLPAQFGDGFAECFPIRSSHRETHTKIIGGLQHQNNRLVSRRALAMLVGMKHEPRIDEAVKRGDTSDPAIAHRLRILREAVGLSQTAIADVIGTSFQNYQHMETNGRIRPQYVDKLDIKYGADHNFIYKGDWDKLHARTLEAIREHLAARTPE